MNPEILLAEDEEHISKLIEFKLKRDGMNVTLVKNGEEAIETLSQKEWSLLVLDVMMPIMSGWEVLKKLRSSGHAPWVKLPILILTAKSQQKDRAEAASLGATHFLKKPFDPDELSTRIQEMLRNNESKK